MNLLDTDQPVKVCVFRRGQCYQAPEGNFLLLVEEKIKSGRDSTWLAILLPGCAPGSLTPTAQRAVVMERFLRGCRLIHDFNA